MATRSREKTAKRRENADKRPRAIARYIRISSRKVKIVIDLIRGKSVAQANAILMGTSLMEGATGRERNGQIGGHRA